MERKPGIGGRWAYDTGRQSHLAGWLQRTDRRRFCGQQARQMNAGANGAVVRHPAVLGRSGRIVRCPGEGLGGGGCQCRGCGRAGKMQVPEGQSELDGERKERAPRPKSHISPEPAHRICEPSGADQASTLRVKENRRRFEHFVMVAMGIKGRGKLQLTNRPPAPSFRAKSIPRRRASRKLEASLPS